MKSEASKWTERFEADPESTVHALWGMGRCMRRASLIRLLKKNLSAAKRELLEEMVDRMITAEINLNR